MLIGDIIRLLASPVYVERRSGDGDAQETQPVDELVGQYLTAVRCIHSVKTVTHGVRLLRRPT
jgi:hypothetical protein